MRYRYLLPSEHLKEYVDYYFIIEKEPGEHALPVDVLPAPQAEMVFTYGDERSSYSVIGDSEEHLSSDYAVSGFFTQKASYRNTGKLGVIMVGFKPWGIQPFIDFSISELTNQNLDIKDVYPARLRTMEDEIRTVRTDEARISITERFLAGILRPCKPDLLINASVKQISLSHGQIPIHELAKTFHLCEKQFKRRFIRTVGITPKLFSRLVRYQYILGLMDNRQVKLLDIAIRTGFYDESHFIKEFEDFTHTSPGSYLKSNAATGIGSYFEEQVKKSLFYNTIYK
jgi:AraC-like DNA-binding protein